MIGGMTVRDDGRQGVYAWKTDMLPTWKTDLDQKQISVIWAEKTYSVSIYPVLLMGLHTLIFLYLYPQRDLPVYDDANYFGYAVLFANFRAALYGDWSPILIYVAAVLYKIFPFSNLVLYAVYTYICQWVFLFGMYTFIKRFTERADWAFYAVLLIATVISYPLSLNGHLFPAGIMMFILAWVEKQKSMDLVSALALILVSILLRVEYFILSLGFVARWLFLSAQEHSWKSILRFDKSAWSLPITAVAVWLPLLLFGTLSTHRLEFAFEQKFALFAKQQGLYKQAGLPENAEWTKVAETFFPLEKRRHTPIQKIFPLYSYASANPDLFQQFLWNNAKPLLRGDFSLSDAQELSSFMSLFIQVNLIILLLMVFFFRQWKNGHALYLSLIFLLSYFSCLLTVPSRNYLLPAIAWFIGVLPFFWLRESRYWKVFFIGCLLTAAYHQYPLWNNEMIRNQAKPNRYRAEALRLAARNPDFRNCTIAEAYPVFSVAFNNRVKHSFDYRVGWDSKNQLRAENGKGAVIDYVLLEQPPPDHPFHDISPLTAILQRNGQMIAEYKGFSVWKIIPIMVYISGRLEQTEDFCLRVLYGSAEDRQLVVRWNVGKHHFKDFHLWVLVDGQEKKYLGRTNGGDVNFFVWKAEEYWVDPPFKNGPEFGHNYEFIVYGIQKNHPTDPPLPFYTQGPVTYQDAALQTSTP